MRESLASSAPNAIRSVESPLTRSSGAVAAFWEGVAAPWAGWHYMKQQPDLRRYGVIPCLLNLLVTGMLAIVLVAAGVYCINVLHPLFAGDWLWRVLEVFVALAVLVVAFGLAAIVWVILQGIFCGHFYAKLAEHVELRLGMKREEIQEIPFSHQALDTLRDAGFLATMNLGLLLLHCVPGVGSVISAAGSYYVTCVTLGLDFLEYPLALRGKRRPEMRAFARRHRAHTIGLGTGVSLVSLVPVVNAVLLTTAVAGAVLLHRTLDAGAKRGRS